MKETHYRNLTRFQKRQLQWHWYWYTRIDFGYNKNIRVAVNNYFAHHQTLKDMNEV